MSSDMTNQPTRPCYKMQQQGKCKFGAKCHFSHDPAVLSKRVKKTHHRQVSKVQKQLNDEAKEKLTYFKHMKYTAHLQRQADWRKRHTHQHPNWMALRDAQLGKTYNQDHETAGNSC